MVRQRHRCHCRRAPSQRLVPRKEGSSHSRRFRSTTRAFQAATVIGAELASILRDALSVGKGRLKALLRGCESFHHSDLFLRSPSEARASRRMAASSNLLPWFETARCARLLTMRPKELKLCPQDDGESAICAVANL